MIIESSSSLANGTPLKHLDLTWICPRNWDDWWTMKSQTEIPDVLLGMQNMNWVIPHTRLPVLDSGNKVPFRYHSDRQWALACLKSSLT